MKKQKIVRAIALSLAITGAGFIFAKEKMSSATGSVGLMSQAVDSVSQKTSAIKKATGEKSIAPMGMISEPAHQAAVREESKREEQRASTADRATVLNSPVAIAEEKQEKAEEPVANTPEQYRMGKMEMNLDYVMAKDEKFLAQNPVLKQQIESGQSVDPSEIYFPPGFRLSLRFEPSCLNTASSSFTVEQPDEIGKSLIADGHPVYVGATLKQGLRGDELMKTLERERCVGTAGADLEESLSAISYSDPMVPTNSTGWLILKNAGLTDMFASMNSSEFGSATATLAVVDSGVDIYHPDLRSIASGQNDDQGHGTKVAGTAAAPANRIGTVGSMPIHARVVGYKVNTPGTSSAYASTISNGITRAAFDGMDVINVSWSGFSTGSYNSAIQTAVSRGALVTGAAGNDGSYVGRNVTISGAISIGALNGTNSGVASYSNYGPGVEVYTPGTYETTSYTGGYSISSGTSFAAPLVGGIGLMAKAYARAHGSTISASTIETIIHDTGILLSSSRGTIRKMQPLAVLNRLRSMYGGGSVPSPTPTPNDPWAGWGSFSPSPAPAPAPAPAPSNPWSGWN